MYNINKLLGIFYYNIMQLLRNVIHLPAICFPLSMFHVCIYSACQSTHASGVVTRFWQNAQYVARLHIVVRCYYIICFVPQQGGGDLLYGVFMRKIGFLVKDIVVKCLLYLMEYIPNVQLTPSTVQGFEIERSQRFWFLRKNVNTGFMRVVVLQFSISSVQFLVRFLQLLHSTRRITFTIKD